MGKLKLQSFKKNNFLNQFKMFSLNFWFQNANRPSTSQATRRENQSQERDNNKQYQDDDPMGSPYFPATHESLSPTKKKRILQGPCAKL